MKRKKVWRYYCEFCGKGSCSGGHMNIHEKHCTRNPNRKCRMCDFGRLKQQPIQDLIKALGSGDNEGFEKLSNLADGCPACILSAINQSGLQRGASFDADGHCTNEGFYIKDFDFKKSKEEFLQEANKDSAVYY